MASDLATPVPNRGFLYLLYGYLVLVLLVTLGMGCLALTTVVNGATNDTKGAPVMALVGITISPLWFYILAGIRHRLRGDPSARILPTRDLFRSVVQMTIGSVALGNGVVGAVNLLRGVAVATPKAWGGAILCMIVGAFFVSRAVRPTRW